MVLNYFALLCFSFLSIQICSSEGLSCLKLEPNTGFKAITESDKPSNLESQCWIIEVPKNTYVQVDVPALHFFGNCSDIYLRIAVDGMKKVTTYCGQESNRIHVNAFKDVNITFYDRRFSRSTFRVTYTKVEMWRTPCELAQNSSGVISFTSSSLRTDYVKKCWFIKPQEDAVVHLSVEELKLYDPKNTCYSVYVEMEDDNGRIEKLCQNDFRNGQNANWTKTFLGAVNVSLFMFYPENSSSIRLRYKQESINCIKKNHFRCSPSHCIRMDQVCNGIQDCEDGSDERNCGIIEVRDFNVSRDCAVNWLKKHQTNFGWGRNTHRAITALYLANATQFTGSKMEEELMVKQLQLKLATALLRNATDPMSMNELSMYVNALTVTCHNDRNIFSKDLLKILADRAFTAASPSPGAYLTLCNAKWPFTRSNIQTLLDHLEKDTEYHFRTEIQAMTVLALSCIKNGSELFEMGNNTHILGSAVENLMSNQRNDGSFGIPHTTAIVTQALVASGQQYNSNWNLTYAMQFLMNHLNSSSVDFLSVYLTLPLLSGKTLADIGRVHCKDNYRKLEEDDDVLDVIDQLGGTNHVQYSLYIGDLEDVVYTIKFKAPDNSTAYDVMKIAQILDPKYKFSYHTERDHVHIYGIAGITNDMETGKYWLFYSQSSEGKVKHHTTSPDQIIVGKDEHLIMWYKTANI